MKESLIKQCLDILKTEDVRNEIKIIFSPVTDLILYEIYPYIYVIIFLVWFGHFRHICIARKLEGDANAS